LLPGGAGIDLDRREMVVDASDISTSLDDGTTLPEQSYYALLYERGQLVLSENQAVSSFEGEIDQSKTYAFGSEFFIGDIVQVVNEYGIAAKTRVVEFTISVNMSGILAYPTFETI
jgi:hypothetical protein